MLKGLSRWHSGKESAGHCRTCKRCGFDPWVGKIPWKKKQQSTTVFLPAESHGQRSLVDYSPWGLRELDTTEHTCTHTHTHTIENNQISLVQETKFPGKNNCKEQNRGQEMIKVEFQEMREGRPNTPTSQMKSLSPRRTFPC